MLRIAPTSPSNTRRSATPEQTVDASDKSGAKSGTQPHNPAKGKATANPAANFAAAATVDPTAAPLACTSRRQSSPEALPPREWEQMPPEVREHIACQMSARTLASFAVTSKANLSLARSAQVILHQRPAEAARSLRHLADIGAADAIQQLTERSGAARLDWGHRDTSGATKLMAGLPRLAPKVIDTLLTVSPEMSAGMDYNGDNILHRLVDHGDAKLLDRMLAINPHLAAYIDLPGKLRPTPFGMIPRHHEATPLQWAYLKHHDALVARMAAEPIEAIDQAIDLAAARYRDAATTGNDTLRSVFPFDRAGIPIEGQKALDCMSGFQPIRRPAQSRMAVALEAILDHDAAALDRILTGLPADVMHLQRERLIREVMGTAHFPAVRIVANHYGPTLFAPLFNGETVIHLAAGGSGRPVLEWLLTREGHEQAEDARDGSARTPLLSAAKHGNATCLELLVDRRQGGLIDDVDVTGNGVLRTLFEAAPEKATDLFDRAEWACWVNRITREDKTATLAYAIRRLLEHGDFRVPTVCDQEAFGAHLEIIEHLLFLPRRQVDVQQRISPTGEPIIDILESGCLTTLVRRVKRDGEKAAGDAFGRHWVRYDNARNLSLAYAHL